MAKYEAVILAYRNMVISEPPRTSLTAMIPVHGKPMVEWVIDALRSSSRITSITVIGPNELDSLLCMRYAERRIATLTAAFDLFLQLARDMLTQAEFHNRYIIIPCEAIFISAPVIDKIITRFEATRPDIAIPSLSAERLGKIQSIKSTFRYEGKSIIPGIFAIAKSIQFLSAAIRRLSEVNRERDLLRNSNYIQPLMSTVEDKAGLHADIDFKFLESDDLSVAQFVSNQDDLNFAIRTLPKPFIPTFSKVKLIINPHSAAGTQIPRAMQNMLRKYSLSSELPTTIEDYVRRIHFYLNELGIHIETVVTQNATNAYKIAQQCAENKYDLVIAAGGDGTINAVINGIACSDTALGIIPLGTVNVLALLMNIPSELRSACQLIGRGKIRTVDLGKANGRFFSSLLGVGFDAYTIHMVNSKLRRIIGGAAYIITGIFNLIRYQFKTIRLTIDNQQIKRSGYLVVVGNGKYYSASMVISPQAKMDDGFLDVVIFKSHNFFRLITYFWKLRTGNLTDLPDVEYHQGKHISIAREGNHFIHVDGEVFGHTPVDITICTSALKIVS